MSSAIIDISYIDTVRTMLFSLIKIFLLFSFNLLLWSNVLLLIIRMVQINENIIDGGHMRDSLNSECFKCQLYMRFVIIFSCLIVLLYNSGASVTVRHNSVHWTDSAGVNDCLSASCRPISWTILKLFFLIVSCEKLQSLASSLNHLLSCLVCSGLVCFSVQKPKEWWGDPFD